MCVLKMFWYIIKWNCTKKKNYKKWYDERETLQENPH